MIKQLLPGHDSPETCYLIDDYPYGRTLRCQMRVWVETKKGFGQRVVRQTSDPKREARLSLPPGSSWNKPHAGIYTSVAVLYLDEEEHVHHLSLRVGEEVEAVEEFARVAGEACGDEYRAAVLRVARRYALKSRLKYAPEKLTAEQRAELGVSP